MYEETAVAAVKIRGYGKPHEMQLRDRQRLYSSLPQ